MITLYTYIYLRTRYDIIYNIGAVRVYVWLSFSFENNKLGLYSIYIDQIREYYIGIVTICACMNMWIYVCVCKRSIRCRFYDYRANGLKIYVYLLFAALRCLDGSNLAVNNIPVEGTSVNGTEVWWRNEGCCKDERK